MGISGLVAVGMGVIVAMSLTMLAGFPYNGIHGTVPFIALGIILTILSIRETIY